MLSLNEKLQEQEAQKYLSSKQRLEFLKNCSLREWLESLQELKKSLDAKQLELFPKDEGQLSLLEPS